MAAPTVRGVGTYGVGTTSVVAAVPTGGSAPVAGDLMVIVLESANGAPATPSGWTQLFTRDQADEAAVDTTLTVYAKLAAGGDTDVTLTGGSMGNHGGARMVVIQDHGVTTLPTDVVISSGSGDATAGSGKTAASITVAADSLILACFGDSADQLTSVWSNPVNANLTGITTQIDNNDSTGNGGGIFAFTGACAGTSTGTSSADLTATTRDGWNSVQFGIPPGGWPPAGSPADSRFPTAVRAPIVR